MGVISEIINVFSLESIVVHERIKIVELSFEVETGNMPAFESLVGLITQVPQRDTFKIEFISDSEDTIAITNKIANTREIYEDFLQLISADSNIRVSISIEKEIERNTFSIYDFPAFSSDLLQLSIQEVMASFSLLLKQQEYLIFDLFDQDNFFMTGTMIFTSGNRSINLRNLLRSKRLQSCRDTSYFFNSSEYHLLPDDFSIEVNYENNPLTSLFDKITTILSLAYISSMASVEDSKLKIQINGQRCVDFCYDISSIGNNRELFKIYQWIYTDGSPVDKAIIARNIISLHCRYSDLIEIDEKTFSSIQSNFNLYLKSSVNQYLELKNKLAEFICDVISKTGEHATQLLGNLKSNLIAIFAFLFTVILANIVSDQPLENIFTKDITAIIELVLLGSMIYLVVCTIETKYKLKKTKESYYSLKDNYVSVLSELELKEVFKNDELIVNAENSVNRGIRAYVIVWAILLLILLFVVEHMTSDPIIIPFIDKLKMISMVKK
jgi:hypothetical protein